MLKFTLYSIRYKVSVSSINSKTVININLATYNIINYLSLSDEYEK